MKITDLKVSCTYKLYRQEVPCRVYTGKEIETSLTCTVFPRKLL